MSRRDNKSLLVRGVPSQVLEGLAGLARARAISGNAIVASVIGDYADGVVTPAAEPAAFDPDRKAAAPHEHRGELEISGLDNAVFGRFMERAKRDGWFSKNALIIALLQDRVRQSRQ